jgi:hypothetical protein
VQLDFGCCRAGRADEFDVRANGCDLEAAWSSPQAVITSRHRSERAVVRKRIGKALSDFQLTSAKLGAPEADDLSHLFHNWARDGVCARAAIF